MNNQTLVIAIVAVLLALAAIFLVYRATRRQRPVKDEAAAPHEARPAMTRTMERVTPATPPAAAPAPVMSPVMSPDAVEGHGVADEAAAAAADVFGEILDVDAHHDRATDPAPAPGDTLTQLKGLGPKAAAQLHALGVTRFAQIAAWTEADVTAIDAQMGAFKGRIVRDRWVEQARLLSAGDVAAFEAHYGKLG